MNEKYEHKTIEEGPDYPDYTITVRCGPDCPACAFTAGLADGEKKGRAEVVKWINENLYWQVGDARVLDWQAKLKEWGIEP